MSKSRNAAKRLLAATFCAGSLLYPAVGEATHSWGGYHWARTTPQFTLKLGDNLTSTDWKTHLTQTSGDWNSPQAFGAASSPILTAIVAGGSSHRKCSMVPGTTQVCNGAYGSNGWLGLASINLAAGTLHITQGSAKMNDSYFGSATYNNPNEREHVMCQEVAHTFGLDHQSTDGSSQNTCMDYFSNAGSTVSTRPNAHDFDELNIVYSHLDATTTVAAAAAIASASSVGDVDEEDPDSWGQLVEQSPGGRSSKYARFNRDASISVTHVYWTLETAEKCPGCDHRYQH